MEVVRVRVTVPVIVIVTWPTRLVRDRSGLLFEQLHRDVTKKFGCLVGVPTVTTRGFFSCPRTGRVFCLPVCRWTANTSTTVMSGWAFRPTSFLASSSAEDCDVKQVIIKVAMIRAVVPKRFIAILLCPPNSQYFKGRLMLWPMQNAWPFP